MHSDYPLQSEIKLQQKDKDLKVNSYGSALGPHLSEKHRDYNPHANDRDCRHLDTVRDWRFSEAVGIGLFAAGFTTCGRSVGQEQTHKSL